MPNDTLPTVNDFLDRLYTIQNAAAGRAREGARAIAAGNAARGLFRSGATLRAVAGLVEGEFHTALSEMVDVLRHMKSIPGVDFPACRDQTIARAHDMVGILEQNSNLASWCAEFGGTAATNAIQGRMNKLRDYVRYQIRQFDVGLDLVAPGARLVANPTPPASGGQDATNQASPLMGSSRNVERASRPYQVALSFAGEQRDYVSRVADALAAKHIAVFYDRFEANALWGKDGAEYFHQIFAHDSQFVVMFISTEYVSKSWTRHERRAAISRQMESDEEFILPVRFDETPVPGLPATLQYLDANRYSPAELAVEIAKKVGISPTSGKASDVPAPTSGAMSGEVTFDYGSHNGRYIIGRGATAFETCWSKASDTSIYLMNDPPSIHGIAIARGATELEQIKDASEYDFTSRVRAIQTGQIAVLRNVHGFFAAIKVLGVEDSSRGSASDALTIRYAILPDGGKDFGS
ncbi:TIR domain-containing protein [Roseomonas sp. JC162]|uniref:TIR domain-containing protein n=1 Tax=Neoroseomonas marina TaxID=1232220 RepID=A0A848EHE5_9PROT|nr:TIR domain-containing protein [Neoroseomonas marina]NMJ42808.1 TIR domain-containing protein [Neoroseomonas marina]